MHGKALLLILTLSLYAVLINSCGDNEFLPDAVSNKIFFESGDILVLSGGNVARTASPYPIHEIVAFSSHGEYKGIIYYAPNGPYLMGMGLTPDLSKLLFTMDTSDQIMEYSFNNQSSTIYLSNAALTGNTMRTLAVLSDNSVVVAESTSSIEKFDATKTRVTTGFPITVTASIMKIRSISGDRFVVLTTGGDDRPRVYTNAGALTAQINGLTCANNCDPTDIVELADGRFVITYQSAAFHSLELFSSTFAYIGQLYQDLDVIRTPSAIAQHVDGDILVCTTAYNTCEKIKINGNTGTRIGTTPFISNAGLMRQPTDIVVVP